MKLSPDFTNIFRFNAKTPGPHVLVTAGVHGDEFEPILATLELIEELPLKLISGHVTVVTMVNVSACSIGNRLGEDDLDVARICPGKAEGSVSEKSAFQISTLIQQADYLIDMHTGGFCLDIFPMAGYMLHSSPEILMKQQQLAQLYKVPVIWGTDNKPDGRTLSVARDVHVPAIYLEYGGGSGIRNKVVKTYKEGFINVLKFLGMVKGPAKIPSPETKFWVEDSRPNSGYFQEKMPSPMDGIFVPEKKPGDRIKKGNRFGKIMDPFTGNSITIPADMDGLVLSVRVSAHVKKGEGLGVILPIIEPGKVVIY